LHFGVRENVVNGLRELLEKMIAAREAQIASRLRAEGHLLETGQWPDFDMALPAAKGANDDAGGKRRQAA
jgi:hypothetical protein